MQTKRNWSYLIELTLNKPTVTRKHSRTVCIEHSIYCVYEIEQTFSVLSVV